MDVTVLSGDALKALDQEAAAGVADDAPSDEEPAVGDVARSQPTPEADPAVIPPDPESIPDPLDDSIEPDVPLPDADPEIAPDPLDDLMPVDPGMGRSPIGDPPQPASLEDKLNQPAFYRYSDEKILSSGESGSALLAWGGQYGLPSLADPLDVPYLLGTRCLASPPEQGILAVVLDADGAILKGPDVISSTGYAVLDDKAIAMVSDQNYSFPARQQAQAYSLRVRVAYPAGCP
jgi:hypothetical protein